MGNKEKNFVSAVIYVHNEEDRIREFLKMMIQALEGNFEHSEIICVNDSSDDKSVDIIREVSQKAETTNISVINMSYFHGVEIAMRAGVDISIGDFVFEFDSVALDFGEEEIMGIYRRSLQGYDIVSSVPDQKEKFTSKVFYWIFDRFSAFPYQMKTERFRILSRRVINRIASMNKAVPYRKAVYANQGLKTDRVAYEAKGRVEGKRDRQEKAYKVGLAIDSLLLFTEIGYKVSAVLTGLMMLISVFMLGYAVVVFAMAHPVAGWTTTILFLSIAFFGVFAILTVVVKYLQLLINFEFKRKYYSFEGIEKLTK